MLETDDGFEIARRDLEIRGPGEFLGARQSGAALLRFADLALDEALVVAARRAAERLLAEHPQAAAAPRRALARRPRPLPERLASMLAARFVHRITHEVQRCPDAHVRSLCLIALALPALAGAQTPATLDKIKQSGIDDARLPRVVDPVLATSAPRPSRSASPSRSARRSPTTSRRRPAAPTCRSSTRR